MAYAALKSGAGLSTLAVPRYLVPLICQNILEVIVYPINSNDYDIIFGEENINELIKKKDVITCGMGLGQSEEVSKIINHIIRNYNNVLVLDADALNIISKNISILNEAKAKIVLTPHMMEFKRLYDSMFSDDLCVGIEEFENNKIENAKRFLGKLKNDLDVVLLLKGPNTIVFEKKSGQNYDIKYAVIDRGTPGMSTAGSGDVLSGIISGFLGYIKNTYEASIAASYINGLAGEIAAKDEGEISMTARDTVYHITDAIKLVKS